MQVSTWGGQWGQAPAKQARLGEELLATEVQSALFLQLWSTNAVNNSPLNPSIR